MPERLVTLPRAFARLFGGFQSKWRTAGDEKIRENHQNIFWGARNLERKSRGICPNSILELQAATPKLGTQLAWKTTVVGFASHVPETNPAMAQISGMVQFLLVFLHLISLFPLFPLNLLPLPCLHTLSLPLVLVVVVFAVVVLCSRWPPLWGAILESVTPQ